MEHHWRLWLSMLFSSALLIVTASCGRYHRTLTETSCDLCSAMSHRAKENGLLGIEASCYICPDNKTLSTMRIRVQDLVGKEIMLEVKRSSQVEQLKTAIEARLFIPTNGLVLVHSGRQLGWSLTLGHYSIQPDDRILIFHEICGGSKGIIQGDTITTDKIRIFIYFKEYVNHPEDICNIINTDSDCLVKSLIEKVKAQCEWYTSKLFFNEQLLEEDKTLSSYNINDGDILRANTITIYINNNGLTNQINHFDRELLVNSLCKEIKNPSEIAPEKLFHRGRLLDQNKTLSSFNIHNGATLTTNLIQIIVKNSGKNCTLNDNDLNSTVDSLYIKIGRQCNFYTEKLLVRGNLLENCRTLSSYNFKDGAALMTNLIQIIVEYSGTKCILNDIKLGSPVKLLYTEVTKRCEIYQAKLFFKGKLLEQDNTLSSYDIEYDTTLTTNVIAMILRDNGKKCSLKTIDLDVSVELLYTEVNKQCEFNPEQILFSGILLDKSKTLSIYHITDDATLTTNVMAMTLNNNGTKCVLKGIDRDFTVESLYTEVNKQCKFNPENIFFSEKLLDKSKTLGSYNITDGATLNTNIIWIRIKVCGETINFYNVNLYHSVESLQYTLTEQIKISEPELFIQDQLMKIQCSLAHYHITDGDILNTGNCIYLRFNGMKKPLINLNREISFPEINLLANYFYRNNRPFPFIHFYLNNEDIEVTNYKIQAGDILTTNVMKIIINVHGTNYSVFNVNREGSVQKLKDKFSKTKGRFYGGSLYLNGTYLDDNGNLHSYQIFEGTILTTSK